MLRCSRGQPRSSHLLGTRCAKCHSALAPHSLAYTRRLSGDSKKCYALAFVSLCLCPRDHVGASFTFALGCGGDKKCFGFGGSRSLRFPSCSLATRSRHFFSILLALRHCIPRTQTPARARVRRAHIPHALRPAPHTVVRCTKQCAQAAVG